MLIISYVSLAQQSDIMVHITEVEVEAEAEGMTEEEEEVVTSLQTERQE